MEVDNNTDDKPKPIPNPAGGDPICPGGTKIDNQFKITDKINPKFECIPDKSADEIIKMVNNNIPVGGKHRKKMTRRIKRNGRHRRRSHRRTAFTRGFFSWFIL